jgi:hypothetical protein
MWTPRTPEHHRRVRGDHAMRDTAQPNGERQPRAMHDGFLFMRVVIQHSRLAASRSDTPSPSPGPGSAPGSGAGAS